MDYLTARRPEDAGGSNSFMFGLKDGTAFLWRGAAYSAALLNQRSGANLVRPPRVVQIWSTWANLAEPAPNSAERGRFRPNMAKFGRARPKLGRNWSKLGGAPSQL